MRHPFTRLRLLARATGLTCAAVLFAGAVTAADAASGISGEKIVVTEQATDQILLLDSDRRSWQETKVLWRWRPTEANGLGDLVAAWGAPSDAKLRHLDGRPHLLAVDSRGLAAIVPFPDDAGPYWATDVGRQSNLHSIELLPDGNAALIASRGNWLRVYTASQGPRSDSYVEFPLTGGHGVFWDDDARLLWALGGDELVALRLGGTPARPELTEVRRARLPTPGGHDLHPVAATPDRLWITTESGVYQYSASKGIFLRDYPGADRISVGGVKSVGDDRRSGQVLTARVQHRNLCTWCTDTATLNRRGDALTLHGSHIYKARWWVDPTRPGR
ncbi:DUF6528 family protein [Actinomadura alba]|uniref:WD40 repeat domain-containing protein n=1 Tax=Actinomadura alba TaxID=406431 RepID=A0ABR7LSH8_9ACTN|nr:DUF6528 family protein [Actinomadura alba]MBC6467809.1 hypothetical protein [Actinomadura alba]